jgi:hypothetical protein
MKRLGEFGFEQDAPYQSGRTTDLKALLRRYQPRHIFELGSGLSTIVFAEYCYRTGAALTVAEENEAWAAHVLKVITQVHGDCPERVRILTSHTAATDGATHFLCAMPKDADFVYVDGPSSKRFGKGKLPNSDVVRGFDAGIYPRVIVVDGRIATVDLIRGHPKGVRYGWSFAPIYVTKGKHPDVPHRLGQHTIALYRQ